jgi:hypothetical protein
VYLGVARAYLDIVRTPSCEPNDLLAPNLRYPTPAYVLAPERTFWYSRCALTEELC